MSVNRVFSGKWISKNESLCITNNTCIQMPVLIDFYNSNKILNAVAENGRRSLRLDFSNTKYIDMTARETLSSIMDRENLEIYNLSTNIYLTGGK
jgi:anti-anti-sigma regulatory factor